MYTTVDVEKGLLLSTLLTCCVCSIFYRKRNQAVIVEILLNHSFTYRKNERCYVA